MSDIDSRLDTLRIRYRASLTDKRDDIARVWHAVRADCTDTGSREILLRLVHRLAGSAESYGFEQIGRIAARADLLLDQARSSGDSAQQTSALRAMFEELGSVIDALLTELCRDARSGSGD